MVKNILVSLVLLAIFVYTLYGIFLYFQQNNMIYFPTKQHFNSCTGFENSEKINHEGTRIYYKHLSETLFVFYHGNAGSACDRTYIKDIVKKNNVSYMIVEYAGFSSDDKKPSKELILKDVENVIDFIGSKKYKKTIIGSESIGGGPASYHASIQPPDKLLLISPFDSTASIAKKYFPIYPISLLLHENYENDKWLKNYEGKTLILHGSADSTIPIKFGKKLFSQMKGDKEFIGIDGAGHNDMFSYPETEDQISKFISK